MEPSGKGKQPSHVQVPGQFLGYGLQYTRMLSLLLDSDEDAVVSLEVFEDVGVEKGNDTLASQTKSSTTNNPVSNRAEPFWKSLFNWLEALGTGQLVAANTLFELYVFGDFEGEICTLFSAAKSESEANAALAKARALLTEGGKALPDLIKRVLDTEQGRLESLVTRFSYRHGSGVSVDDLKDQLRKTLIPPEFVENALTHAIGWVKQEVDTLIEKGQLAKISVLAFRKEMTAYVRFLIFSACFADLAGPVRTDEVEGHRSRRYVSQLKLISVADERVLRAISAYLRSSVNRSEWGRLALIHEHSFDDFEKKLLDYWENSQSQCDIELAGKSLVERGQYLLAECMKFGPPLQGQAVPHDFVEGSFHALADDLTVGWHPEFKKLMEGK